ncbi:hypothetical protein M2132_001802 [Dysgonomonas sp. PH5-45]|uniref:hypothetical protein n=1 Tax=unclassified Dysgonomonas TaxID=2630389 RepID=UPI002474EE32|nr:MULTISPECIES: hypothetical protein [unclassified Dysgonomonas]MDH6355459.1 hypothetical protein [Dysgonomonas sp. PH5-45]MDH6388355.1 hypothetical protein [Dysgonomonas sp. PH5-37]
MALIISDIVSEYGAYYIKSGQNESRLRRQLLFSRETTKLATPVKTEDTVYRLAQSTITELVQAFQKDWTPKGDLKFTPNPIPLYNLKVDIDLYPDEIKNSWLAFLESNNLNRKDWPLVRYMIEKHVFDRINDDMERNVYYKGVFAAPTAGTASTAGSAMNGLEYLLKNNTGINHVTLSGALDPSTIYDQMEEFYEKISEEYQNTKMVIGVAPKWRRAFLKDKRAQGWYDISSPGQIDDTLDFSPARVIGLPSMIGSDDIWATPLNNFLYVTRFGENAAKVKIEESKRCVSVMTDWWEGFGFGINEVVWTTVPAAVTP